MAVDEQRIQSEPLVLDDLTPYAGGWVAIRDGHVVASALDPIELRDRTDVSETDVLMPVPTQSTGVFVL
jgi:hypothetical protein